MTVSGCNNDIEKFIETDTHIREIFHSRCLRRAKETSPFGSLLIYFFSFLALDDGYFITAGGFLSEIHRDLSTEDDGTMQFYTLFLRDL